MYDAIIIGAGHNGLVCASYLARAGLKVAVFERRDIVGGMCVSEEIWPGYKLSTGAYVISLFKRKFINDLKLEKFGFKAYLKDPMIFIPFKNMRYFYLWSSLEKTKKEIEKFSKKDALAYEKYDRFFATFADIVEFLMMNPPLRLDDIDSVFEFLKNSYPVFKEYLKEFGIEEIQRVFLTDAKTLLDEYFESDEVKAALVEDAIIGSMMGPSTPGSAYLMAHHEIGEVNGVKRAWGYVEGGMGGLTLALRKAAEHFGVDIFTQTQVKKIIVRDNRAVGIELDNGKTFQSKIVVSNADPKTTFLKLIDQDLVPKDIRKRIELLKSKGIAFKIVGIIEELPDYVGLGKTLGPHHVSSALVLPSMEYAERAFRDALNNTPSKEPVLSINIQSSVDKTVTKDDKHVISIYAQYAPYDKNWDERKDEYTELIIDTIRQYAPNFKLEKHLSLSPLDLERRFGATEGNIFHIDMSLDQLYNLRPHPSMSNYATFIDNLYICGSGAHPGGGVSGIPGYNAAMRILNDLSNGKIK
ncbi:MAG TPA: NAD(P)/FAD-dependent oxidoreductase [Geobacterales bacterium]|nr:NAD(P)/FAD-dependent oxidoreductase [Geobacterales bacterium]